MAVTVSASPESTTEDGPLTAAMPARSACCPVRCAATSSSSAWTAIMAPPAGSSSISRPRAPTSSAASARVMTPAACAAAISPMECPARWSGVTPQEVRSRNRAVSTAKRAACAYWVRWSSSASGEPGSANSTSPRGTSRWRSRWSAASWSASANTGNALTSSRPMPRRWLPWPVNRNAVRPVARVVPVSAPGAGAPSARAVRVRCSSSRSAATTVARSRSAARVVAAE